MTIIYDGWTMDREQALRNRLDREDRAMYAQALTWLSLVGPAQMRIDMAYDRLMKAEGYVPDAWTDDPKHWAVSERI